MEWAEAVQVVKLILCADGWSGAWLPDVFVCLKWCPLSVGAVSPDRQQYQGRALQCAGQESVHAHTPGYPFVQRLPVLVAYLS